MKRKQPKAKSSKKAARKGRTVAPKRGTTEPETDLSRGHENTIFWAADHDCGEDHGPVSARAEVAARLHEQAASDTRMSAALDYFGIDGAIDRYADAVETLRSLAEYVEGMKRYKARDEWTLPPPPWGNQTLDWRLRSVDKVTGEVRDEGPRSRIPAEPEPGAPLRQRARYWIESIAAEKFEESNDPQIWFAVHDATDELARRFMDALRFEATLAYAERSSRNARNPKGQRAAKHDVVRFVLGRWPKGRERTAARVVATIHEWATEGWRFEDLRIDGRRVDVLGSTLGIDGPRKGALSLRVVGKPIESMSWTNLENATRALLGPST